MAPSPRRRRLLAALVGVTVALLVAELAVRLFLPSGDLAPERLRAAGLPYGPAVFSRVVFRRHAVDVPSNYGPGVWRINALGYRGPDFAAQKPQGTRRVMIYGGSSVFDLRASEGDDWPRRVERLLHERGLRDVEVINAGVPATHSADALGRLFAEGHGFAPDVAVLYGTWNDLEAFSKETPLLRHDVPAPETTDPRHATYGLADRALCRVSHLWLRARSEVLTRRRGRELEPVGEDVPLADHVSAEGPRQYELTARTWCRVARAAGAVPVLATEARLVARDNGTAERARITYRRPKLTHDALCDAFERADAVLREVGRSEGATVVDVAASLRGRPELFWDHVHTLPEGSAAVARAVADGLQPLLQRPR
jgi:lysophospholipase L1-like esterase